MTRAITPALALAAALLAATPAVAQEGTPVVPTATEADYATVAAQAVKGYIIPAYGLLEKQASELRDALRSFCAAGQPEAVKAEFAGTLQAWAGVDFLHFGPMAQEGRYERFAFWPDVHGTGARQLRQFLAGRKEALLEPGALVRQSAAVQGLPALESLLFAGKDALLASAAPDAFQCRLAVAVADNMSVIAAEAVEGWTKPGGWAELIGNPGETNPVYRTHAEAMTEILRGILTGLEQDRDQRLLPALGASPDEAKASRAPYNRSGQSLRYLQASAHALQRFAETSGILGLLPYEQRMIRGSIGFEFANLQRALSRAGPDLQGAIRSDEGRDALSYAAIVLASLRHLFQNQFAPQAGLTPGFNSLDGD